MAATAPSKAPAQSAARSKPSGEQAPEHEAAHAGPHGDIAQLQRLAGNRAVAALFARASPSPLPGEAQPLEPSLRADMEARFQTDFRQVRIHAGEVASALARSRRASAYTQGKNIVFGGGRFDPHEAEGRSLLAHELAHVVQQSRPAGQQPGPAHEQEAEAAASLAAASGDIPVTLASAPGSIQCAPPSKEEVRNDVEKERERFEGAKEQHERRLADLGPRPVGDLPIEVFKKAGVTTTTTVGANTAGLIDSVLERSGVLRPYIKDKLSGKRKVRIPGDKFAHYNEEGKFDKAYQRTYGTVVAGSAEEKELKNIHGFYSTRTDTIHLRPKANVGDALHESIHKFSSNFLAAFGKFLNEGVTQFFTDLVLEEQGLPKGKSDYAKQLECAHKLVDLSGRDLVGKAYFMGDIGPLINGVARGLKIRAEEVMKLGKDGALCDRL